MSQTDGSPFSRRGFVEFLGLGVPVLTAAPALAATKESLKSLPDLDPQTTDRLETADGFEAKVLVAWGDAINDRGDRFGFNNDYTAYIELSPNEGLLWVNHEYPHELFVSGYKSGNKTKQQVDMERASVGGSILHIRKDSSGAWSLLKSSQLSRRLDASTKIPFVADRAIAGANEAEGTFANCAGGVTPWRTILTCEENYQDYYGELDSSRSSLEPGRYGWKAFYDRSPEHYGWVVEVNAFTGEAKKLTGLGRFAHEGATVTTANDGRCVVYMGDDKKDECIYKFIADVPGSLEKGSLYVADVKAGKWRSLMLKDDKRLRDKFKDQTDALIFAREAAKLVGGTPMDRPEAIAIDPRGRSVIVALTNNTSRKNYYGSLFRIDEDNADPLSLTFKSSTMIGGGKKAGFACPDNVAYDRQGNLWMTTDISDSKINKGPYAGIGHNGVFVFPGHGPQVGQPIRVITGPVESELTGPSFTPDGRTLFLSVQHPGAQTKDTNNPTSHWPDGGRKIPRPAVVAVQGPTLERLTRTQSV